MEAVYVAVSWYHHQGTTFVSIDVDGPQERLIMYQQTIILERQRTAYSSSCRRWELHALQTSLN